MRALVVMGRMGMRMGWENGKNMLHVIILILSSQPLCSLGAIAEAAFKYLLIFSKLGYGTVNLLILLLMTLVTIFICQMIPLVWSLLLSKKQAGKQLSYS